MRLPIGYRLRAIVLGAAAIWLAFDGDATAQQPYDDASTAEGWAWALIKEGKEVNFDTRCQTPALDPGKDDERWNDACRRLSASFIGDVLTREPWRSQIPAAGVNIMGARIADPIDLENATLNRVLSVTRSRIEDAINLNRTRTDSIISLDQSRVGGSFSVNEFRSDSSLWARAAQFKHTVALSSASIAINLDLDGATVEGPVSADSLHVGDNLFLRAKGAHGAAIKNVSLVGARIDGQISLDGATVDGTFNADSLHTGTHLFMRSIGAHPANFKNVTLRNAAIGGVFNMEGATVDGRLDADSIRTGAHLFLRSTDAYAANFQEVNIRNATIGGQVDMSGATFAGTLYAYSLHVGFDVFMRSTDKHRAVFNAITLANSQVAGMISLEGGVFNGNLNGKGIQVGNDLDMRKVVSAHTIDLAFAHVTDTLDTRGSTLASLNLSGASIGNLLFGNVNASDTTAWKGEKDKPGRLNLRNAHVSNLADAPTAWPEHGHLSLAGFTFNHLGGLDDGSSSEMRGRGPAWWDEWLRRDPVYRPSSYEQLAAAFTVAGDRAGADEIRYRSRIRQREETTHWWVWASSLLFQYTAGFGIGDYTFRVLYWVIGVSLAGALYLWGRVPAARQHGPLWCCGASLSRLLPIIEINKEFTDFFDDPARKRLTGFDTFLFSVVAMVGWLLGAILIAAVSGLVPKG